MHATKSDSSNVISWMKCLDKGPRKSQFIFNEIKYLSTSLNVGFRHMYRSTNGKNALAKLGVDRDVPFLSSM